MGVIDTLWLLVPDSAMPVVLLAAACLVLLGIVRPLSAAALALVLLAAPVLEREVAVRVAQLPWWLVLLAGIALASTVLRGVLSLFLGSAGASHLMALMCIAVLRAAWRLFAALMRGLGALMSHAAAPRQPGEVQPVAGSTPVIARHLTLLLFLVAPTIASAQLGRGLARGFARGAVRSGEKRAVALLARDARRDAATAITRLRAPRAVFRYATPAATRREARRGFATGQHFTSRAAPGRPMTGGRAWRKYGLPRVPKVRQSVTLPRGAAVRFNRALGGQRGVGEISLARPVSAKAIKGSVRLHR